MQRLMVLAGLGAGLGLSLVLPTLVSCGCYCCFPEPPKPAEYEIVDASIPDAVGGTVEVDRVRGTDDDAILTIRFERDGLLTEVEYGYSGG